MEQQCWSNPEQFKNIKENENVLRQEHGLPQRKYHVDYAGFERAKRVDLQKIWLANLGENIKFLSKKQVEQLAKLQIAYHDYKVKSVDESNDIEVINIMIKKIELTSKNYNQQ